MELLPLWVEFFDELQHVRGRSQNTVMAYRRDLELYAQYKGHENSHAPVAGFYEFMKKHKLSPRSQARVVSSLRTYYKFCESRGMKAPELRELRPPKVKVGLPKSLGLDEFEKLLLASKVDDLAKAKRNQMTLMLLFGLGCRVSELIGLNLEDYNETDRWLKILGKGNKERLVPLTDQLSLQLNDYIQNFRESLIKEKSSTLLVNDRGHRPSRVDIWRWLAAWSERAGFEEPVGPHRFRHGCATALLESGADLRSIQMLLGHSSIQTTQIYTNVTTQNLVKTVDDHHPLSRLEEIE
ncbi:MAG: tyrosine-type recombinase/integrase [Pseudobdellovibrionaceae bacterium]